MVEIYCALIRAKRRSFDSVPDNFKDDVEARLKELGYNKDGDPIL